MATRTRRFALGMITGYAAILINILYTIFSVRIALHYLGKQQFGLWALALQVSGYMALLDLGMSSAISRFVADHKDDVNGGAYGSPLLTGGIVFAIQGILIVLAGAAFSLVAPTLFHIPLTLATDFQWVLVIITATSGFTIACRSVGAPLWAFQRQDVTNMLSIFTLVTGALMLWMGFRMGWGIYALAIAGIPSFFLSPLIIIAICYRRGYYPSAGKWGTPSWILFCKVFRFGKDVLLMSLGTQLVNASQIMIISRIAGLDAAATFSVGTKFYTMGQQFVGKILESASPGLTELFVRGDRERFNSRFWSIVAITGFLATGGAVGVLTGNQALVSLWTSGVIHWKFSADIYLAALLVATCLTRCLMGIFGMVGNFSTVRYIYFFEGCAFIGMAIPATRHYGINGILAASLLAHLVVTACLSLRASTKWLESMKPIGRIVSGVCSIVILSLLPAFWIYSGQLPYVFTGILSLTLVIISLGMGWFFILTKEIRQHLYEKLIAQK